MIRKLINNWLNNNINNKEDVALLFSGGLDSLSILLSCLDVGIKPNLYTFRLSNYISEDYNASLKISKIFNLKITEIILDTDKINLVDDITKIINKFNTKLITKIQCIHPFLYIVPVIKESIVLTGLSADDLYGNTKKMAINSKNQDVFNSMRMNLINNLDSGSYIQIKTLFNEKNKELFDIYKIDKNIIEYMMQKTYKELNSPKQKMETYIDYKDEIDKYKLYRSPSGFQCNSKIREWHNTLLDTDLNTKNYKRIDGIYNQIYNLLKTDKKVNV